MAWNYSFAILNTNSLDASIVLEWEAKNLGKVFKMLNLYGPCYPPFLGITKEMVSRGPWVAYTEYQEGDE